MVFASARAIVSFSYLLRLIPLYLSNELLEKQEWISSGASVRMTLNSRFTDFIGLRLIGINELISV